MQTPDFLCRRGFLCKAGMRSDELCSLRPWDLTKTEAGVWLYEPTEHKTAWRGKRKVVPLGRRSMELLQPYLESPSFCFSPATAMREQRELRAANRKKDWNSNKSYVHRGRIYGERYDAHSYQTAVNYAFVKLARSILLPQCPEGTDPKAWSKQWVRKPKGVAISDWLNGLDIAYWHPHQLRHSRATLARSAYGLEGAQALLGNVVAATERYAERSLELAIRIANETG